MKTIGLIVNPVAGIGGRAGLKGSDGSEIQKLAKEKGFESLAPIRVGSALKRMKDLDAEIQFLTCSGDMGEKIVAASGFPYEVVYQDEEGATTPEDTMEAAKVMKDKGVDFILFAGGDGTARNICTAVGQTIPVLGIPCGVKMHSSCFAITPSRAADITMEYFRYGKTDDADVMDIDEEEFREGHVKAKLYGSVKMPAAGELRQVTKAGSGYSQVSQMINLGNLFAHRMEPGVLYIVAPGSSTTHVMKSLGLPFTLLGVDLVVDKQVIAQDVDEHEIWEYLQQYEKAVIIVTIIGGQGYLFGRGNQQISPRIIRKVGKDNIWIIASKEKLVELRSRPFLVDTGDPALDQELCGFVRVPQSGFEDWIYQISV